MTALELSRRPRRARGSSRALTQLSGSCHRPRLSLSSCMIRAASLYVSSSTWSSPSKASLKACLAIAQASV